MSRFESIVVVSLLAVALPLLLTAFGWFGLMGVCLLLGTNSISPVPGTAVLVAGFLGGSAIDIFCLRRWARNLYEANLTLMTLLFLVSSLFAIALCMGVPVGNLVLGVLAGLYIGRRNLHAGSPPGILERASRKVGLFAGVVVASVAFAVGMLALFAGEEETVRSLVKAMGVPYGRITGVGFIVGLCVLLLLLQYGMARSACLFAYGGWRSMRKGIKLFNILSGE